MMNVERSSSFEAGDDDLEDREEILTIRNFDHDHDLRLSGLIAPHLCVFLTSSRRAFSFV
jgi:hypothetical protein